MAAAKLWLSYVLGRPQKQPETMDGSIVDLCEIRGLEDAQRAGAKVVELLAGGKMSLDVAERMMRLVESAGSLYRGIVTPQALRRRRPVLCCCPFRTLP